MTFILSARSHRDFETQILLEESLCAYVHTISLTNDWNLTKSDRYIIWIRGMGRRD